MAMEIWILFVLAIALAALFLVNRLRRRRTKEMARGAPEAGDTPGNVYPLW